MNAEVQAAKDLLEAERQRVFERVVKAHRARDAAQVEYEEALLLADSLSMNISEIARACDVSEAALRYYIKRHGTTRRGRSKR